MAIECMAAFGVDVGFDSSERVNSVLSDVIPDISPSLLGHPYHADTAGDVILTSLFHVMSF